MLTYGSDDELGDEDHERRRARGRTGRDGGTAGGSCLRRSGAAHRRVDLLPGEASDGRAAVEASGERRAARRVRGLRLPMMMMRRRQAAVEMCGETEREGGRERRGVVVVEENGSETNPQVILSLPPRLFLRISSCAPRSAAAGTSIAHNI